MRRAQCFDVRCCKCGTRGSEKTGDAFEKKIWMNHPMTYRGYRISQASFSEGTDGAPTQSTLQVMKDPGWPLKWIGSILIVAGITTMFYFQPRKVNVAPQCRSSMAVSH